jgi:hypothetical protein
MRLLHSATRALVLLHLRRGRHIPRGTSNNYRWLEPPILPLFLFGSGWTGRSAAFLSTCKYRQTERRVLVRRADRAARVASVGEMVKAIGHAPPFHWILVRKQALQTG